MTWLIWKVSTWFCKHGFDYEETSVGYHEGNPNRITERKTVVSATCKHCGWHRRYSKFF